MSQSHVLADVRSKIRQGELALASKQLAEFVRIKFQLDVKHVEIRVDAYSLNSVNGFISLATTGAAGTATKLFFKFHQEEGEEETIKEYYQAKLLQQYGYRVDLPLYTSSDVGEQFLIYALRDCPRFADRCHEIESGGFPPEQALEAEEAQRNLDKEVLDHYRETLHLANQTEVSNESILQLFYWRLVSNGDQSRLGGRWSTFFGGKEWEFPGLDKPVLYDDLAEKRWIINGVRYTATLGELFTTAHRILNPRFSLNYPAVVAHGDAHNANVWFSPIPGENRKELVLFDPAFAGAHVPALLAEIKPTFHNILAHQEWLYQPQLADRWLDIEAVSKADSIEVRHNWQLNPLRQSFLNSKAECFWRPWLAHLKQAGMLPDDWRSYIKIALFCCPTLVMNLRAAAGGHTPKTSLLGLSIAVMAGSEPESGQVDMISEFIERISP